LVELVDRGGVRPRQSVRARVQTRGQNNRLPHPGGGGIGEQPVEMPAAHGHSLRGAPRVEPGVDVVELDLAVERPHEEVEADCPHQRLGVRIVDQPFTMAQRTLSGDHRCGRTDARREVPAVIVGAGHGRS
jgi:hypothetical protein